MAQRASGFDRVDNEFYPTPGWVVEALNEHFTLNGMFVWEPACGSARKMQRAMTKLGARVRGTDVVGVAKKDRHDFLAEPERLSWVHGSGSPGAIITNPPYGHAGRLAIQFIDRGHDYLRLHPTMLMALLLPNDFDSGKTRVRLFRDNQLFRGRITLTRRIMWFPSETGAGSSANHAWFIWGTLPKFGPGTPVVLYAPRSENGARTTSQSRS